MTILTTENIETQDLMTQTGQNKEEVVTRECEYHGPYEARQLGYFGRPFYTHCPECQAERKQKEILSEKNARALKKAAIISRLFGDACIPPRFKDRNFDNYRGDSPGQSKALSVAKKYAESFDDRLKYGGGLVFCGKPGTGKTHLSAAIANHVIINFGRSVLFTTVIKAVRHVKETYSKASERTESEAIYNLVYPDLLILDEVGVQFGTEAEKLILFEILNGRYEQVKPTILLSNLPEPELTEYIGSRVLDRMKEGGGVAIAFDWDSYRSKVHKDTELKAKDVTPQDWETNEY